MRRSLILLILGLPVWAQFQPAPQQQPYPQDLPGYQAQSQYPTQQQPYPQYPAQQYPPQQQYPTSRQPQYPSQQQQPYPQQDEGRDFAADQQHGVARIRIVQGDVNVKRGDNGVLSGAIMNAPMFSHDHIETGPGSRAEIELDNANVIRVAPDTDLGFANLAFGHVQAQLGIGTVIVRVLRESQTQLELDTPSVAFHPLTPGEYRISVFENGTSQVTARSGRLDMSSPQGSQTVEQGQTLNVRGDANAPEFQPAYELPRDQFDEWSTARDAEEMSARSAQYVSGDVYGAEDLDRYGNWVPSPQYGQVWAPQGVGPDWSPYSNGQWTYSDYYGWTWIGYEPWGWAPYHYGRWFYNTGVGWCWWPGARLGFGFHWSPALVGFFGFGGGLGWVSLAPFEIFHPWWGHGFGGYGAFRGGYELQHFRNAGIRGGALTASYNSFAGAGHRFNIASAGQLRGASMFRGSIPVSANGSAYRFSDRAVNSNLRLSQAGSRSFYSSRGSFNGSRYATPSGGSGRGGWQSFGTPAPQRQQSQSFSNRPGGNTESGWHGFGVPQAAPRNTAPAAGRSYGGSSYGGSYRTPAQSYNNNYRAPSAAPHYSAPSAPRSAPAAPHYSAPKSSGGGSHPSGGGGGGHSGGGGHHR